MTHQPNDRSAWIARHVLPHEPALRRYLSNQRLPNGLDVDDVVQEVFGRLAEAADIAAVRDVRGYMLGMARNIVLMQLRRSRVVSIRSAEDFAGFEAVADEPSPEEVVSDREQLHRLALAIALIREPWRTAFLLRVVDELPHAEIGRRLGMSENAVQKSHAKTLIKLMQLLGRGGNASPRATETQSKVSSTDHEQTRDERGD